MKIEISHSRGHVGVYITIGQQEIPPNAVVRTTEAGKSVLLDWDLNGELLGIEILSQAEKVMVSGLQNKGTIVQGW